MDVARLARRQPRRDWWRAVTVNQRLVFDVLLVGVLMLVVVIGSSRLGASQLPARRHPDGLSSTLAVLATASLLGRRMWPLEACAASVALTTLYIALRYPYGPILFVTVIALYTVASRLPWQQSLVASTVALGTMLGAVLVGVPSASVIGDLQHAVTFSGWLIVPWIAGLVVRVRSESRLQVLAERLRRSTSEERLAIAREIHDVVGHGLAVITMQSGVALHLIERRPEQARVALEAIHQSGKAALDELRATLSAFRGEAGETGTTESRLAGPGLGRLDGLVSTMSGSGLSVRCELDGEISDLPATTDLAAYRIIQESLTNVLRHSGPGSTVRIRIERSPGQLVTEIADQGDGMRSPPAAPGSGLGIPGMRERCATLGGTFAAGPRLGGGFRVRAILPTKDADR